MILEIMTRTRTF
jgi:hypothetical protein